MAMLRLAVADDTPRLYCPENGHQADVLMCSTIRNAAPELPANAPIVILVHGYRYDPFAVPLADPHQTLFSFDPVRGRSDRWQKTESWPLGLGFSPDDTTGKDGLCVAFGWRSRPATRLGRFCVAYGNAEGAGRALLRTVELLARVYPDHPVDFVAHSLGARVVLSAMRLAAQRRRHDLLQVMGRAIMLGPAELAFVARNTLAAMDAVSRRRSPMIYAILARENDVFDALLEHFAPALPSKRPRLGIGASGLGTGRRNWLNIQLDHPETLQWLAERGAVIGGGARRACHWGVYNRPGALGLYAAILRDRPRWSLATMREEGVPEDLEPRWSRLPWFLRRRWVRKQQAAAAAIDGALT